MIDARPTVLTVTQLNNYVKRLLDGDYSLNCVFMVGEISNFNNHYRTGHMYFTLKDEKLHLQTLPYVVKVGRANERDKLYVSSSLPFCGTIFLF